MPLGDGLFHSEFSDAAAVTADIVSTSRYSSIDGCSPDATTIAPRA